MDFSFVVLSPHNCSSCTMVMFQNSSPDTNLLRNMDLSILHYVDDQN